MSRGATCRRSVPSTHQHEAKHAMTIELAVIGGTGVYALGDLTDVETHQPVTPYGAPSGPIRVGTYAGKRVAFLARHGEGHSIPPHRINYRANLAALKALGATR